MVTGRVCCRSSLGALRHLTGLPRALQLNPLPWGLSPSAQGPAPGDAPRSLGGRRRSVRLPSEEVRAHAGQGALSPRRLWNSGHTRGTSLDLTVG